MPVATAKIFGSKIMSVAGKSNSDRSKLYDRSQILNLASAVSAWPPSSNAMTTIAAPNERASRALAKKSTSPSLSEIEFTIDLPWMHIKPARMTFQSDESSIIGTLAISGSDPSN